MGGSTVNSETKLVL